MNHKEFLRAVINSPEREHRYLQVVAFHLAIDLMAALVDRIDDIPDEDWMPLALMATKPWPGHEEEVAEYENQAKGEMNV
jgi:hypothetical protein